ncbi:MAG: undecaprenyl/decaprenyl-phosphate alpha-N-acetylglucosaminyl 1-phosphate transferase, partial [Deltaproteobacteria bacterium]
MPGHSLLHLHHADAQRHVHACTVPDRPPVADSVRSRRACEIGRGAGGRVVPLLPSAEPRDLQLEERRGVRGYPLARDPAPCRRVSCLLRGGGASPGVPSLLSERFQVILSAPAILAPAAVFLLSLLLALYLTPIFRDAARRFGIVDAPDGKLKTQKNPVPYLGGVAVFAAVLFPVSLFLQFSDKVSGLLLACSIIVLLGLIDAIGWLSAPVKLLVQVTAVFLMMKSGIRIRIEAFPPLLCVALTFLWMIVMTNGFNLIDVMDGLAAGVATVSALALAVVFVLQGNRMGLILCLSLVGALLGFLRFNRPPAQIYLGDTGSLLIGFLLGGLAIEGDYTARNPYGWLTALAIFSVPLFEIAFVSWLR